MPELSNLLRQRLAATENGGAPAHPDADTLTAYVEQSLAAAERQDGDRAPFRVRALPRSRGAEPA